MFKRFQLGSVVSTPGALRFAEENDIDLRTLITRHLSGDWGDLCGEDKLRNDVATHNGSRIFSSYNVATHKLWVITEADRSSTCILLPEEY